jgi:uncharacterized protein (DUF1015 family)
MTKLYIIVSFFSQKRGSNLCWWFYMPKIAGLTGLRPKDSEAAQTISTPPYDVIHAGSGIEQLLLSRNHSMYHIILGNNPKGALENLVSENILVEDTEPSFYVLEQKWNSSRRVGVLVAAEVSPPAEGKIRDHEDTIPSKVEERIRLAKEIGYTTGPVFCIAEKELTTTLNDLIADYKPLFEFTSDFSLHGTIVSDLHSIKNRVFKVPQKSNWGELISNPLKDTPFYIADGHHRYEAALKSRQTHFLAYVTPTPFILAYNRLINSDKDFESIKDELDTAPATEFKTPERKGQCCIYTQRGIYTLRFSNIPDDVVGRLDVSLLKRDLYGRLGLDSTKIKDNNHFHYLPETELDEMKNLVDIGKYSMAIALHPVSWEELKAVADAGKRMPEKSTYFFPKILTGLFLYNIL